ncbi:Aldehyde/histidinol dehydrogenase [Neohortaea acidophila]|uniref:Multifunctional fusion protein n=1 Tax=Neohortaea acidophila TaxID=245834 RepID=A0A6A6Q0S6_9PEZI|nr:Aldehyde/histidinol dehydrogenase [Neohortaea acidophila]KAF2486010.1 Aldehyde/histidinol dehydrogenase [Neohortaea acidophila]
MGLTTDRALYQKTYAPGSAERNELGNAIKSLRAKLPEQIPIKSQGKIINDKYSEHQINPSRLQETVAHFASATPQNVEACIEAALATRQTWGTLPFRDRAEVFLKAADLIAGRYRSDIVAATMLGQGKNAWQAEIDAAAEICDFFRAYVYEGARVQMEQPNVAHTNGVENWIEQRPLDGFVYAVTPFNFTALGATLVGAPAIMGNPVIWKPSPFAVHASWLLHQILIEAGLPQDVVQFLPGDAEMISDIVLNRPEFSGLSYIGSTAVLKHLMGTIGKATAEGKYQNFPRVVGEAGGKNYHLIHASANVDHAVKSTVRAAFELSGQKCSACSRAYVAESIWPQFKEALVKETSALKVGDPEDYVNFVNPVIHERAFDSLQTVITNAKNDAALELITGGKADKSKGYYVDPTVYTATDPRHDIMSRELFGPILAVHVYPDSEFSKMPELIDTTSSYGLTGAVFAEDQEAIRFAKDALSQSAGNFYINSKCTGAVVAQQPFGGARASGTNDKTGTMSLLLRWTSPRTVMEGSTPLENVLYPSNEV